MGLCTVADACTRQKRIGTRWPRCVLVTRTTTAHLFQTGQAVLIHTIISNPGPLTDCLTCIRFFLNTDRSKSKHVLFISDWLVYHIYTRNCSRRLDNSVPANGNCWDHRTVKFTVVEDLSGALFSPGEWLDIFCCDACPGMLCCSSSSGSKTCGDTEKS